MIVWGWRRCVRTIAVVTTFTLFFVPLFPVNRRFEVRCTFCGATGRVSREQAEAMQQQVGANPVPAQQPAGFGQPPAPQAPPVYEQTAQLPQPPYPPHAQG